MPTARAATTLGSWSSVKNVSGAVSPNVLEQVVVDGRVRLRELDPARDEDAVEPVEPLETLLGVRELLGRPVGQRVEGDARVAQLGKDRDGVGMIAAEHLGPALVVGPEDLDVLGVGGHDLRHRVSP